MKIGEVSRKKTAVRKRAVRLHVLKQNRLVKIQLEAGVRDIYSKYCLIMMQRDYY